MRGQHDERNGGFGRAPKFPPHSVLTFLLRMHRRSGSEEALAMALRTLKRMADGGIHDQLGGGFHRYAVDAIWLVPHFEQMLYDNALLARAYLAAWQVTGDEQWRDVAEGILDYLLRELALEHGGFASAQDADTDGVEGPTFTWTPEQLRAVLSEEDAALAERTWGVTPDGNFEGATVLSLVAPPENDDERARLALIRGQLLEARSARPQPALDDKALASWNGMALAALAEGARLCRRPDLLAAAERCAAFLLGPLSHPDGGLWRTHRAGRSQVPAFLDDYAQVATGLYELYLTTREHRYLAESHRLALLARERFGAPDGSFFDTAHDAEELVARPRELDDNPTPSGNSTLAGLLAAARAHLRRARARAPRPGRRRSRSAPCWRARRRASATCSVSATRCSRLRARPPWSARGRSGDGRARRRAARSLRAGSRRRVRRRGGRPGRPAARGARSRVGPAGGLRVQRIRLRGARDGRSHGAHSLA